MSRKKKEAEWETYLECATCGVPQRKPCLALPCVTGRPSGFPLTRPHPGRMRGSWWKRSGSPGRHGDPELAADRLMVWKRLARRGVPVVDIANQLGMTRDALERMICRARRAGHPDAVYHINAILSGSVRGLRHRATVQSGTHHGRPEARTSSV